MIIILILLYAKSCLCEMAAYYFMRNLINLIDGNRLMQCSIELKGKAFVWFDSNYDLCIGGKDFKNPVYKYVNYTNFENELRVSQWDIVKKLVHVLNNEHCDILESNNKNEWSLVTSDGIVIDVSDYLEPFVYGFAAYSIPLEKVNVIDVFEALILTT